PGMDRTVESFPPKAGVGRLYSDGTRLARRRFSASPRDSGQSTLDRLPRNQHGGNVSLGWVWGKSPTSSLPERVGSRQGSIRRGIPLFRRNLRRSQQSNTLAVLLGCQKERTVHGQRIRLILSFPRCRRGNCKAR